MLGTVLSNTQPTLWELIPLRFYLRTNWFYHLFGIINPDEEAEPFNNSPYAPSRINDAQSPFKKWSFRLGMITLAAIVGYSALKSSVSDASVQVNDVDMLTHHHISSKSGKSKKAVTELKSSSETELFDDEREYSFLFHIL